MVFRKNLKNEKHFDSLSSKLNEKVVFPVGEVEQIFSLWGDSLYPPLGKTQERYDNCTAQSLI